LDIIKYDVYSGPNIGIFTSVNDKFVFIPNGFAKTKAENLARYLQTEYLMTPVANTRLLGILEYFYLKHLLQMRSQIYENALA